jgi:hypothetical protein
VSIEQGHVHSMSGKFIADRRKQGPLGSVTGPPNSALHSQGATTRCTMGKQHVLEQYEKNVHV